MKEPDFTKLSEAMNKLAAMFEGMTGEDYAPKGKEVLLRNASKNNIKPGMRDGMPLKRKKGRR